MQHVAGFVLRVEVAVAHLQGNVWGDAWRVWETLSGCVACSWFCPGV